MGPPLSLLLSHHATARLAAQGIRERWRLAVKLVIAVDASTISAKLMSCARSEVSLIREAFAMRLIEAFGLGGFAES